MHTINALTFRQKFGQTIDRVVKTGIPLVVERQNKPLVVLYPFETKKEDLERKKREQKEALTRLENWRKKWGKVSAKEKDSVQLIRKMREDRYGKRWLKTHTRY